MEKNHAYSCKVLKFEWIYVKPSLLIIIQYISIENNRDQLLTMKDLYTKHELIQS